MSSFIEDMEAPLQGRDDSIRLAMNAPQPFSAGEVSQKDRAAQQLGTTYGMADAGWDDVQTEMKVQNASRVPKANEWVAEAQENVAFLNEDADALMSVYDDLVANGLLAESDIDRDTMESVAEDGNGLSKALDRARINNQLADLGQSFLRGEILGDDARRETARFREELSRLEGNDPLGFYGAVEQFYRMGTRDIPHILYRGAQGALEGASAGAIAGTVLPGLGSVAGAGTGAAAGFTAGTVRGTFEASQQMEAALFALDLLMQTDDAGQYLDDDTVKNYAQLYGMGSAFVETAGDALALKILSPVLKTVGAAIKRPASSVAKDAIKTAMSDRRLAPVLGRAVRGVAAGAAAEGAEEAAQQAISEQIEALAKNTLNDAGVNYYREDQPGLFGKDAWGNIAESAVEGAKMGMWFHLLPGVTKFAIDTQSVLRAQEFSEANKNALKTIESSKTQQLSPVRMESFLKRQGLNQTVLIPADAAWQMQQAGTDIAGAFGWNIADMEEAAALGQDIAVPLSRIHAAQIPTNDKNTLFDVMRERPESMSAFEAMDESVLAEDVDAVNAAVEEWEYQQDRLDMELDRVRTQMTEAVRSSPVLLRQLTTSADTETSVGMYVDSVMRLLRNAADRLSVYGADADSILDRLNIQGLIRDEETGRMVDPVGLEQLAEERALAEADAPFWENVWGRLDAASLKRDFPEARKELASIHGRGLFAPRKGEGVPVDQLADELKTAGWLPKDADSSTLVEMLKEKRRPVRRKRSNGVRLNQNIPAPDIEYPDGGKPVGEVTPEIAATLQLNKPGVIVLDDTGIQHIRERHGKELSSMGFTPEEFVDYVLRNFDAVYAGNTNNSYQLACVFDKPKKRVIIKLKFEEVGEYYRVSSAGPVRPEYYRKETPLWERAQSNHSVTGTPDAISGQSGVDGRSILPNSSESNTLFQSQETGITSQVYATATGSISSQNGNYYIQLFRGANLSTLAHETMHAVHLEMERLEREGLGTPELKRDLSSLRSWTARMDDDANLKSEYDKYQRGMPQFGGRKFDDLTPEERAISRSIAKEEMVARGFEAYLREGVSPSRGMEGMFRRFKKWLTRIYRQASLLDVELTDDVRRVFDKIVASDEDIRAAATVNNIRTESSELMDALGLRGADRLELEGLVREAEDNAADALRKDRNKAIREQAKKWTTEADEEIRSETVYRVRAAMRKTPIDYESVVESYGRDMADRLMKKLPASVKRGGDNPEALAFDYGFRNAGEMIQAVLDAPGINERRAELIAQKRRDAEARFAADDYLFEQEALVRKEERIGEAVYRLEAEGRTSLGVPIQGDYRERSNALREQIRAQAERILDGKTAADAVRPDVFRRSASKALREERQAILAKDWPAAIQANYRARINLELARQAADRRDLVEKLQKQAKKFLDSKVTDPGARFGVFVLAMKTRLVNPTTKMLANAGDKTFDNIKSFLSKMREEGLYTEDAAIDDTLFEGNPIYWRDMPWDTLHPYLEAMATMMHMERTSRKAHDERNSVEWRKEMDGLAASVYVHNKNRSKGSFHKDNLIIKRLKEFHASHLKADTICRLLDGDEDMGPVWRAIIRPINQATWARATRMRKERDAIKELYSVYSPAEWVDIRGRRYYVDAIKTSITKEQALAVLLRDTRYHRYAR